MAYIVLAYIVMVHIVMAYIVMAYIVMAYVVIDACDWPKRSLLIASLAFTSFSLR